MRVEVTASKKSERLELGDVIVHPYGTYLVCVFHTGERKQYVAKNFKGEGGLFGTAESLTELNEKYEARGISREATVYKASEYKLQLVKKDGA
jgi:hypothetical protein